MIRYDVRSPRADDFINHQEILDTLAYAAMHQARRRSGAFHPGKGPGKPDAGPRPRYDAHSPRGLGASGLRGPGGERRDPPARPRHQAGLSTATASCCSRRSIFPTTASTAAVYCPYHAKNKRHPAQASSRRRRFAPRSSPCRTWATSAWPSRQARIRSTTPSSYILESIETIYGIKHKNGAIRRVNVNIAATTEDAYRQLKDAGNRHLHPVPGDLPHAPATKSCTPSGPKARLRLPHRGPRTAPWPAASTTWGSACCSGLEVLSPTSSPACSCTRSIWKPCSAWARTPSRCRG